MPSSAGTSQTSSVVLHRDAGGEEKIHGSRAVAITPSSSRSHSDFLARRQHYRLDAPLSVSATRRQTDRNVPPGPRSRTAAGPLEDQVAHPSVPTDLASPIVLHTTLSGIAACCRRIPALGGAPCSAVAQKGRNKGDKKGEIATIPDELTMVVSIDAGMLTGSAPPPTNRTLRGESLGDGGVCRCLSRAAHRRWSSDPGVYGSES